MMRMIWFPHWDRDFAWYHITSMDYKGPVKRFLSGKGEVKEVLISVVLWKVTCEEDFLKCATQVEIGTLKNGAIPSDLPKRRTLEMPVFQITWNLSWKRGPKSIFLVSWAIPDYLWLLQPPYVPHDIPVAPQDSLYAEHSVELSWTAAVTLPFIVSAGEDKKRHF